MLCKCPWPPPPPGERIPKRIDQRSGDDDAQIIEWFLQQHAPRRPLPQTSPLARWLENLRLMERGQQPVLAISATLTSRSLPDDALIRAAFADVKEAQKLAWSITVLHSERNSDSKIDASYVTDLMKTD